MDVKAPIQDSDYRKNHTLTCYRKPAQDEKRNPAGTQFYQAINTTFHLPTKSSHNISHTPAYLVLNGMHLLGVFSQITFPEIALTTNLHTALHKARERRVVVDATQMFCVLAPNPKRTLLVSAVGPSAEKL